MSDLLLFFAILACAVLCGLAATSVLHGIFAVGYKISAYVGLTVAMASGAGWLKFYFG